MPDGTDAAPSGPPWVADWETCSTEERQAVRAVHGGVRRLPDPHRPPDRPAPRRPRGARRRSTTPSSMLLSDNGASAEGGPTGSLNEAARLQLGTARTSRRSSRAIDDLGGPDAYNHYPWGWAWAGNALAAAVEALRLARAASRTPLVVRWGDRLAAQGGVRHPVRARRRPLRDHPRGRRRSAAAGRVDGIEQPPVEGASLPRPTSFAEPAADRAPGSRSTSRCSGRGRIYQDGWKAVTHHVANQFEAERATWSAATSSTRTGGRSSTSPRTSRRRATWPTSTRPSLGAPLEEPCGLRPVATRCCRSSSSSGSMAHMHLGESLAADGRARLRAGRCARSRRASCRRCMGGFELTRRRGAGFGGASCGDGVAGIITATGDRHGGWATDTSSTAGMVATVVMLDRFVRSGMPDPVPAGEQAIRN